MNNVPGRDVPEAPTNTRAASRARRKARKAERNQRRAPRSLLAASAMEPVRLPQPSLNNLGDALQRALGCKL